MRYLSIMVLVLFCIIDRAEVQAAPDETPGTTFRNKTPVARAHREALADFMRLERLIDTMPCQPEYRQSQCWLQNWSEIDWTLFHDREVASSMQRMGQKVFTNWMIADIAGEVNPEQAYIEFSAIRFGHVMVLLDSIETKKRAKLLGVDKAD